MLDIFGAMQKLNLYLEDLPEHKLLSIFAFDMKMSRLRLGSTFYLKEEKEWGIILHDICYVNIVTKLLK